LTTDLTTSFEEVASQPQQTAELKQLIEQLPTVNFTLLSWIILHLDDVSKQEKFNKMNAQNLAMVLSSTLQMSHRLFLAILLNCTSLFPDTELLK
jgi:RalA-binding protein 1